MLLLFRIGAGGLLSTRRGVDRVKHIVIIIIIITSSGVAFEKTFLAIHNCHSAPAIFHCSYLWSGVSAWLVIDIFLLLLLWFSFLRKRHKEREREREIWFPNRIFSVIVFQCEELTWRFPVVIQPTFSPATPHYVCSAHRSICPWPHSPFHIRQLHYIYLYTFTGTRAGRRHLTSLITIMFIVFAVNNNNNNNESY